MNKKIIIIAITIFTLGLYAQELSTTIKDKTLDEVSSGTEILLITLWCNDNGTGDTIESIKLTDQDNTDDINEELSSIMVYRDDGDRIWETDADTQLTVTVTFSTDEINIRFDTESTDCRLIHSTYTYFHIVGMVDTTANGDGANATGSDSRIELKIATDADIQYEKSTSANILGQSPTVSVTIDNQAPHFGYTYSTPNPDNGSNMYIMNTEDNNYYGSGDEGNGDNTFSIRFRIDNEESLSTNGFEKVWADLSSITGDDNDTEVTASYIGSKIYELSGTIDNGTNGSYTVTINARDMSGNVSQNSTFELIIDKTPLDAVNLISPVSEKTVGPGTKLSWSAVSGAEKYRIDIADYANYDTTLRVQKTVSKNTFESDELSDLFAFTDGTSYYWRVLALDKAENYNNNTAINRRFTYDAVEPVIINSNVYSNNETTNIQPVLNFDISDRRSAVDIAGCTASLNNKKITISESMFNHVGDTYYFSYRVNEPLVNGQYTFLLSIGDTNANKTSKSYTFIVDNTDPDIVKNSSNDYLITDNSGNIIAGKTINDIADWTVKIEIADTFSASQTANVSGFDIDKLYVSVYKEDSTVIKGQIDTSALAQGDTTGILKFIFEDGLVTDGSNDGRYFIKTILYDRLGQSKTVFSYFILDNTPPLLEPDSVTISPAQLTTEIDTISISVSTYGEAKDTESVLIRFAGSSGHDELEYDTVSNRYFIEYPVQGNNVTPGMEYIFTIEVFDVAGNFSYETSSFSFSDSTPPTIKVDYIENKSGLITSIQNINDVFSDELIKIGFSGATDKDNDIDTISVKLIKTDDSSVINLTVFYNSNDDKWFVNIPGNTLDEESKYFLNVTASDIIGNISNKNVTIINILPAAVAAKLLDYYPYNYGRYSRKYLLLNAVRADGNDFVDTDNIDYVRFEYRKVGTQSWTTITKIYKDTTIIDYIFEFDESDFPELKEINSAYLDVDSPYSIDKTFVKNGSKWLTSVILQPDEYTYELHFNVGEEYNDRMIYKKSDINKLIIKPYSCQIDISKLSDGTQYEFRCVPVTINAKTDENNCISSYITIDRTPTSVTLQNLFQNQRLNSDDDIDIYFNDIPDSIYEVKLLYVLSNSDTNVFWQTDSDSSNDAQWFVTLKVSDINIYRDESLDVYPVCVDIAGNTYKGDSIQVILDKTDPVFTVDTAVYNKEYRNDTDYIITIYNSDIDFAYAELSGLNVVPIDKVVTRNNTEINLSFKGSYIKNTGVQILTIDVYDSSGRKSTKDIQLNMKDVVPPSSMVTQMQFPDGLTLNLSDMQEERIIDINNTITVKGSTTDDDDGDIKLEIAPYNDTSTWTVVGNDNTSEAVSIALNSENYSPGKYYIRLRASDNDGNIETRSEQILINILENDHIPECIINDIMISGTTLYFYCSTIYNDISEVKIYYSDDNGQTWTYFGNDNTPTSFDRGQGGYFLLSGTVMVPGTYKIKLVAESISGVKNTNFQYLTIKLRQTLNNNYVQIIKPDIIEALYIDSINTSSDTDNTADVKLLLKSDVDELPELYYSVDSNDKFIKLDVTQDTDNTKLYIATVDVSDIGDAAASININAVVTDTENNISLYIEEVNISSPSSNPSVYIGAGGKLINRINFYGSSLTNKTSIIHNLVETPETPESQQTFLNVISRTAEIKLLSGQTSFIGSGYVQLIMNYSDNNISDTQESKLAIVYWDETNSKWAAEGITSTTRDLNNNNITVNVNHLSKFAVAVVDIDPAITVNSPIANSYAANTPYIEADIYDSFSSIDASKISFYIDNQRITINNTSTDEIDNDNDGLTDENTINEVENFYYNINENYIRTKVLCPQKLSAGNHEIRIIAYNVLGQEIEKTIAFTVSNTLNDIDETFNYPNPFNPDKEFTKFVIPLTKRANVTIVIYDFAGHELSTIFDNKTVNPGEELEWGGMIIETMTPLANGVYFARISVDDGTKKYYTHIKVAILR